MERLYKQPNYGPRPKPTVGLSWAAGIAGLLLAVSALVAGGSVALAENPPAAPESIQPGDWPQFRGPNGDGRAEFAALQLPWPDGGPAELWSVPLGGGYSGIAAVGTKLYTLISAGSDELLVAFDARDGRQLWQLRTDAKRRDSFGDGPRSTPTVDQNRVYAVSALGHLWCADRHSGEVHWDRDLRKEFGAVVPTWGVSASPIVFQDLLLFNVGGRAGHSLMAFDKKTGEVRWNASTGLPGYSLPLTATLGGVEQSVFFTGTELISVEPKTGNSLWHLSWKTAYDVNAAAPVFVPPDRLFISSGYDTGAALLQIKNQAGELRAEEIWRTREMKNQFSSSIYHDGHLYGFDNEHFKCIGVDDGQTRWRKTGLGHGSLLYADGHLAVLSDSGRLAIVEAAPDRYREKASAQISRGKHWTAPTFHRGRLLVRNQKKLMAFELGPIGPPKPPEPPTPPQAPVQETTQGR